MAYFQAYTNTHAPLSNAERKIRSSISTRRCCWNFNRDTPRLFPDDVVEYLAELNERTYLWVELGLQTVHEKTANLVNSAHDFATYVEGVDKLTKTWNSCLHAYY